MRACGSGVRVCVAEINTFYSVWLVEAGIDPSDYNTSSVPDGQTETRRRMRRKKTGRALVATSMYVDTSITKEQCRYCMIQY